MSPEDLSVASSASQVSPGNIAEPTASVPALTMMPPDWVRERPLSVSVVAPSLTIVPVPLTLPPKVDAAPPSVSVSFTTISAEASVLAIKSTTAAGSATSLPFWPRVVVPEMSAPASTVSVAPVTVTLPSMFAPCASVACPRSTATSLATAPAKRTLPCVVLWTESGVAARFDTGARISCVPAEARMPGASPSNCKAEPVSV